MRLTLPIDGLAPGGEGVGRAAGRTVFVPFAAPGDEVEVEVELEGDGPLRASLLRVVAPGTARRSPPCPHFGPTSGEAGDERGCGGCEWLHVDYPAQLAAKERGFRARLEKLGGLGPGTHQARPILGSPAELRYRSRAKFHFARRDGRLVFFRRRSHQAVPLRECHLLEPALERLRAEVGPALAAAGLEPREVALDWSAQQGAGAAWLRLAAVTGAVRRSAGDLLAAVPALSGLVLEAEGGARELVGQPVLRHARDPGRPGSGLARSRPDVFRQANAVANALLVRTALELLAPEGEDVLELFCGSGNFTGPLLGRARSVAAVEVQGPALDLARQDLGEAGGAGPGAHPPALRLFAGDALKLAHALAREGRRFGAVLLDPPREGARGIGPALRELRARRAVYVSCDPATMARDLKACVAAGFRAEVIQPVDMFPQTHHVEGIALLVAG